MEEVIEWQNRPLDPMYPLVFFDALRVKIREEGTVKNKAVYLALGIRPDGTKEILGIWIEQTEGAKFWLRVMTELNNSGLEDILVAVVDGLKGFPQAICRLSPDANPDLHRPPHTQQPRFRWLERSQAGRRRAKNNLPRYDGK